LTRLATRLVTIAIALSIAFLLLPPGRTVVRSALLTYDLLGLPASPLSALTPEPQRVTLTYGQPADRLDVYLPAGAQADRRLPAVVLELGIHPLPIDDSQVVRLAGAISRLGMVVGVPDSAALRTSRLTPAEPAHLADAVLTVAGLPEVAPARVGLAGFSAGASIALIAAADARISDRLTFVSAFGGYADAETLLVDVATSSMEIDGRALNWTPDPGIVSDVREIAANWDPRAAALIFAATDRATARAIVEALPAQERAYLLAISPVNVMAEIEAPVYLLHGRGDRAIPYSHALLLEAALGPRLARQTTFGRFGHEQPGLTGLTPDDAGDVWELALYLRDIVAVATE
jgi:acetyl esterase/lipase